MTLSDLALFALTRGLLVLSIAGSLGALVGGVWERRIRGAGIGVVLVVIPSTLLAMYAMWVLGHAG